MARQLLAEGATFDVRERDLRLEIDIDEEAVYTLRPLTTEFARATYKKHTVKVPNRRTHQMEDSVYQVGVSNDMLDAAIVGWSGVQNGGTPAPCDLPHKLLLPTVVQAALIERAQVGGGTPAQQAASFRESASLV